MRGVAIALVLYTAWLGLVIASVAFTLRRRKCPRCQAKMLHHSDYNKDECPSCGLITS